MAGDLIIPVNRRLLFHTNGDFGYYLLDNGEKLQISDHDGHMLLQFGYNSVPETIGGVPLATATELAGKANVTEETIAELSSPTQLTHGGRFNIQSISAEINAHASVNASLTDYATGDFHVLLLATHFDAQGCRFGTLLLTTPRSSGRTWVGQIWEHEFRNWIRLATATPPEEHALPLMDGWMAGRSRTKFSISQNSLVLVTFGVSGPANTSDRAVIAQLPPGFRPGELISTECIVTEPQTYTRYAAGLDVNRAGEVIVFSKQSGWTIAVGQVAFYVSD